MVTPWTVAEFFQAFRPYEIIVIDHLPRLPQVKAVYVVNSDCIGEHHVDKLSECCSNLKKLCVKNTPVDFSVKFDMLLRALSESELENEKGVTRRKFRKHLQSA